MYKKCHTEESGRRQRELELGLLNAMQHQHYEKITLTELCRELGVPRKTFYRYFPTKEDCLLALIDHTLTDCNAIALDGWDGSGVLGINVQLRFFTFWRKHETFLNVIRDNDLRYLLLDRTTIIVDKMKEKVPSDSFSQNQIEYSIAHGLMATVLRWHHFGFQSSPEEMAEVFGHLLCSADISMDRLLL